MPPPPARRVELGLREDVRGVARLREGTEAVVALDVPIGLPEHGGARRCDTEARRLLGKGASSVFNPPARYLFPALAKAAGAERWREVERLVRERRAAHPEEPVVGVSRQTIGILDKVADADAYLRAHSMARKWLVECHPEVSFFRMNGDGRLAPKSKAKGLLQRLALVEREFPGTREAIGELPLSATVPLADQLDAYAALWTALRVASGAVDPERDALGCGTDDRPPQADGMLMGIVA